MAYVQPHDAEVVMSDALVLRLPFNWVFLVAVGLCFAFWAAVIAALVVLV